MNREDVFFEDLLMRVIDGEIGKMDFETFQGIIRHNAELRRRYENEARVHGMLLWVGRQTLAAVPLGLFSFRRLRYLAWLAAALALLLAGSFAWMRHAPAVSVPEAAGHTPPVLAEKDLLLPYPAAKRPGTPAQPLPATVLAAGQSRQTTERENPMRVKPALPAAMAAAALAAAIPKPAVRAESTPAATQDSSVGISLDSRSFSHLDSDGQPLEARSFSTRDSAGRNLNTTKFRGLVVMLI